MTPEESQVPAAASGAAKRIFKSTLIILIVLFAVLVVSRIPAVLDRQESAERVTYINKQRITMDDVDGSNLPPEPDQEENNATIEGIDLNDNGIRDDVELAIFEMYPGEENAALRAAALQYALGLQLELTQITSRDTYVAAVEQSGRGFQCLSQVMTLLSPLDPKEMTQEEMTEFHFERKAVRDAVSELTLSTSMRLEHRDAVFEEYAYGHGSAEGDACDIDPETLIPSEIDTE